MALALLAGAWAAPLGAFTDAEGCLLCHKYPRMGRVTEDGVLRTYYILPEVYSRTVHRNVPCRDCHIDINELPHKPVKEGVTCNTECHSIKNPATGQQFSHEPIYEAYKKSVHGRDKLASGTDADKPYCVSCHTNPIYNPAEERPPKEIVDRCVVCHEDRAFVTRWYNHTSRRIREIRRTPAEVVAMCATCHDDKRMIDRHVQRAAAEGRELGRKFRYAVESYYESFHGKMIRYGFTAAASCVDCHVDQVDYYRSVHKIRASREADSPVSPERRVETCKRCHRYADENYARIDPHPTALRAENPFRYWAEFVYNRIAEVVIIGLVGLSLWETWGRRRDGVAWRILNGSSWRRRSRRGRDRVQ